jgi:hypothetical protein
LAWCQAPRPRPTLARRAMRVGARPSCPRPRRSTLNPEYQTSQNACHAECQTVCTEL